MVNYFKYLPVSREDENWGLCVVNTGCTQIGAFDTYPVKPHPPQYNFNWNAGRVLNEYQVIYITRGKGVFESDSCKRTDIKAGTILVLFPGERHRYKPDSKTGWDEYWIGLKGEVIDNLVKRNFFRPENPCLYIGFNEDAFNIFSSIIESTRRENAGYQPLISGAAMHLLGYCHAITKQNAIEFEDKEMIVNKARLLFRSNITDDFSPELAAEKLEVGYSWFRKVFKNHTGLSPGQYYIQLKIERAKRLLNDPGIPIKQISNDLRFESYSYFSKLFKKRTGVTPSGYRRKAQV
ncbi:MAG: AraC family transcriptional regulator [Mucilaginibacter sp.]